MLIYKLLRGDEWQDLCKAGVTDGAPIDIADGFIHFSTADQVVDTAALHFATATDVMLLAYETDDLGAALRWDVSRGGALFPHLYAPLRHDQMLWARPLPWFGTAHLFPESIRGHIDPTRTQFDRFKALDRDPPVEMLNLLRLRQNAAYPDPQDSAAEDLSGRAAYARYGAAAEPIFQRVGGEIIWRGTPEAMVVGPADERWDLAFIARYPSAHAFLAMVTDPAYQAAVVHRQAAIRTARLIRCAPADAGGGFG